MTANKPITDFGPYKSTIPYASELFGVYQPLLGWRAKRAVQRLLPGILDSQFKVVDALLSRISTVAKVAVTDFTNTEAFFKVSELKIGSLSAAGKPSIPGMYRYFITDVIAEQISKQKLIKTDPNIWKKLVSEEAFKDLLPAAAAMMEEDRAAFILRTIPAEERVKFNFSSNKDLVAEIVQKRAESESAMAGALNELFKRNQFDVLSKLFFPEDKVVDTEPLDDLSKFIDPLESFDPSADIGRVTLSPIGIVHLFREYFFEFDTFLGPSVEHIWLSPGASLELVEIHTRRDTVDRSLESFVETIDKSALTTTKEDDLSTAISVENGNNSKFGISVSAGGSMSGGAPGVYSATGHLDATTSYSLEGNQKTAKQDTDKHMRQQSTSLSSEIRRNFKTTFKTTTEIQDVSSVQIQSDDSVAFRKAEAGRGAKNGDVNHLFDPNH
jgi:hypothetical protein